MKKIIQQPGLWLSLLSLLVISACGQSTPESPAQATAEKQSELRLVGTMWELESMGSPGDALFVIPGTRPTLNFFVDRYAGSGGCNWFLGTYSAENDNLRLMTPVETRLMCEDPPGVMEQEATYTGELYNILTYQLEEGNLVGYGVENQQMVTLKPAQPIPLEGTTWSLQLIFGGLEWAPLIPGTEITARFEGNQMSGSAGYNDYRATVTRADDKLTITNLSATERSCSEPEEMMEQEQAYLSALQSVGDFLPLADALILRNGDGLPILLYGVQTGGVQ